MTESYAGHILPEPSALLGSGEEQLGYPETDSKRNLTLDACFLTQQTAGDPAAQSEISEPSC